MSVAVLPTTRPISPKAALTALERIAERWQLRRQDLPLLLGRKPRTVRSWFERVPAHLDVDVLERIGHLVGIFDALHRLFGDAEYADRWVHEPNAAFAGRPPIELLLSGGFTPLVDVHRYLQHAIA
jgi:uncharacterized protein (DUF2384 family)